MDLSKHTESNLVEKTRQKEPKETMEDDDDIYNHLDTLEAFSDNCSPVKPQGVVQFGSIDKILETMEFVNQTKNEFFQNGNFPPLNPIDSDGIHESLTISGTDADLLRNSGDLGHILAPFIDGSHSGFHSFSSECMSMSESAQRVDCTTLGPKERLFSKLGIEELLEGVSGISNADSIRRGDVDVMLTGGTKAAANVIGVGGFIACSGVLILQLLDFFQLRVDLPHLKKSFHHLLSFVMAGEIHILQADSVVKAEKQEDVFRL
ncbi:hypothetical protein Tco_0375467 [Tanacetum coccineum]